MSDVSYMWLSIGMLIGSAYASLVFGLCLIYRKPIIARFIAHINIVKAKRIKQQIREHDESVYQGK